MNKHTIHEKSLVSIMGRESINKQCWECANCNEPTAGWDGSKFRCAFLAKDFGTWHYDVPNECPCKGKGWMPGPRRRKERSDHTLIVVPCKVRALEAALHNYCDHHGAWDADVRVCSHEPHRFFTLELVDPEMGTKGETNDTP